MPEAYIVYNPTAGRFPSSMLTERAAEVLRAAGWKIHLERTNGGPHITELAERAAREKLSALFMAGGDGSINYAIKGLLGSETALGVFPSGTANVWAKELSLPDLTWTRWKALEESARRLSRASIRKVDVGLCNQQPFLLWAGLGLDAFIVHRLEPRSQWEKSFTVVQYATSLLREAVSFGGFDLRIQADGREISGHYLLAVVSNIHLYAGGVAQISPAARLDDGVMDLWLFAGESWLEAVQHAWNLWSGQHVQAEQVRCVPFQQLELSSQSTLYVQLDGEPAATGHHINITIEHQALNVLVPPEAPRALFVE